MERKGQRKFSLLRINLKESQSKIATIIIFVVEVKQMNSLLISFYFTLRSLSPFLFLFSLSSCHPCSRSRWLPHSRLPLHPVQPLSTIRRTITFRSTTLPTSSSLYSRTVLFSAQESSSIIDSEVIPGKKSFAANSACQVWRVTLIRRLTRCWLTVTIIYCLCKLRVHYGTSYSPCPCRFFMHATREKSRSSSLQIPYYYYLSTVKKLLQKLDSALYRITLFAWITLMA